MTSPPAAGPSQTAQVDVFDQQAVEEHAAAVAAQAGGIDIAPNAVSVMHDQGTLLADLSVEEFMRPVDGFLRASFITSKAVARYMGCERPGVIPTLSEPGSKLAVGGILGHSVSVAGKKACPGFWPPNSHPATSGWSVSALTLSSTRRRRVPTPGSSSGRPRRRRVRRSRRCSKAGGWCRELC